MCPKFSFYWLILIVLSGNSWAMTPEIHEVNDERARFNYQLFCQGCHVGDGRGGKDVPNMKGKVGDFLALQKGREYLIRVPGAANSALDDKSLAELMNWILLEIGKDSVPENFSRFTEQEVGQLRKKPLMEVVEYRAALLKQITKSNPALIQ